MARKGREKRAMRKTTFERIQYERDNRHIAECKRTGVICKYLERRFKEDVNVLYRMYPALAPVATHTDALDQLLKQYYNDSIRDTFAKGSPLYEKWSSSK